MMRFEPRTFIVLMKNMLPLCYWQMMLLHIRITKFIFGKHHEEQQQLKKQYHLYLSVYFSSTSSAHQSLWKVETRTLCMKSLQNSWPVSSDLLRQTRHLCLDFFATQHFSLMFFSRAWLSFSQIVNESRSVIFSATEVATIDICWERRKLVSSLSPEMIM